MKQINLVPLQRGQFDRFGKLQPDAASTRSDATFAEVLDHVELPSIVLKMKVAEDGGAAPALLFETSGVETIEPVASTDLTPCEMPLAFPVHINAPAWALNVPPPGLGTDVPQGEPPMTEPEALPPLPLPDVADAILPEASRETSAAASTNLKLNWGLPPASQNSKAASTQVEVGNANPPDLPPVRSHQPSHEVPRSDRASDRLLHLFALQSEMPGRDFTPRSNNRQALPLRAPEVMPRPPTDPVVAPAVHVSDFVSATRSDAEPQEKVSWKNSRELGDDSAPVEPAKQVAPGVAKIADETVAFTSALPTVSLVAGSPPSVTQQVAAPLQAYLDSIKPDPVPAFKMIEIRLEPEFLGSVDVALTVQGDTLEVRLRAEKETTADMLQSVSLELQSALVDAGYDRARIVIDARLEQSHSSPASENTASRDRNPSDPGQSRPEQSASHGRQGNRHDKREQDQYGRSQPQDQTTPAALRRSAARGDIYI